MLISGGLPYSPELFVTETTRVVTSNNTQLLITNNNLRVYLFIQRIGLPLAGGEYYQLNAIGNNGQVINWGATQTLEMYWERHNILTCSSVYFVGVSASLDFSITEVSFSELVYGRNARVTRKPEALAAKIKSIGKRIRVSG